MISSSAKNSWATAPSQFYNLSRLLNHLRKSFNNLQTSSKYGQRNVHEELTEGLF